MYGVCGCFSKGRTTFIFCFTNEQFTFNAQLQKMEIFRIVSCRKRLVIITLHTLHNKPCAGCNKTT